jgi:hypothetical protein
MLAQDINSNRELKKLVTGILEGGQKRFYPYKEFSTSGAACIIEDENSNCAIRNKVFEKFLRKLLAVPAIKTEGVGRKPALKSIPYGIANYHSIRDKNFYYVDKTNYLEAIEQAGMYLFFIRPRRFGKTLFLSMMETYYDVNKKDDFNYFFEGTDISRNPTPEKNAYLILKFDFSKIVPSVDQVETSFFNHVKDTAKLFVSKYSDLLDVDVKKTLEELMKKKNPSDLLSSLLTLCQMKNRDIYLIIDEYDNFANTILSTAGSSDYESLTHGEGFFRAFFNVIKSNTSGSDAPVSRLFMTGVSPITLDDVTSGFNIGLNISIDTSFNEMMGFNQQEVTAMIEYYRDAGKIKHSTEYLLDVMSRWYNHYRFSKESNREVFNSVQVLYFLNEYFKNYKIPDDLIDRNVRIDYDKLKHLIIVDKGGAKKTNGNFSKLKGVIEKGFVKSKIEKGFPMKKITSPENFISLLFYFGLLTIEGVDKEGKSSLKIPNETVKRLFYEYIAEVYTETEVYSLDLEKYSRMMENMAYKGKWQPLFEYITNRMKASISLRDLISGEKSIQAFLHVYLGLSNLYIIHTERELSKGYGDIVMEPFTAKYEGVKYSYLIEIKYMKRMRKGTKSEKRETRVQQLKEEAERQLMQYEMDEKFRKSIEKTTLVKLVLVFSGHDLVYFKEVGGESPAF